MRNYIGYFFTGFVSFFWAFKHFSRIDFIEMFVHSVVAAWSLTFATAALIGLLAYGIEKGIRAIRDLNHVPQAIGLLAAGSLGWTFGWATVRTLTTT